MKKLLILGFILFSYNCFSQNFAYSYSGVLTEEQKTNLISEIEKLHFFEELKIKEKETSGQLFFTIPTTFSNTEAGEPYTTSTIKALLIDAGLQPLDLNQR